MSFPYLAALSDRAVATEYSSTNVFKIGNLGMTEDGSLYRLCKGGAAMTNPLQAKINYLRYLEGVTGDCAEGALSEAISAGDESAVLTDATNSRAADYWKDGYLVQPRSSLGDCIRRIWKSDAEVSDTYRLHVTAPFLAADDSGNTIQAYPNPWSDVRSPGAYSADYEHFVAFANNPITSGYYFWGKVHGPHWCWVNSTWPGAAAGDRLCVFHTNGTIVPCDEKWNAGTSQQIAGYLMYSGNYGDALLMVCIE